MSSSSSLINPIDEQLKRLWTLYETMRTQSDDHPSRACGAQLRGIIDNLKRHIDELKKSAINASPKETSNIQTHMRVLQDTLRQLEETVDAARACRKQYYALLIKGKPPENIEALLKPYLTARETLSRSLNTLETYPHTPDICHNITGFVFGALAGLIASPFAVAAATLFSIVTLVTACHTVYSDKKDNNKPIGTKKGAAHIAEAPLKKFLNIFYDMTKASAIGGSILGDRLQDKVTGNIATSLCHVIEAALPLERANKLDELIPHQNDNPTTRSSGK